jgi:hypothetical protein
LEVEHGEDADGEDDCDGEGHRRDLEGRLRSLRTRRVEGARWRGGGSYRALKRRTARR